MAIETVNRSRTWKVRAGDTGGYRSDDILTIHPSADDVTFLLDLSDALNPGAVVASVTSVSATGLTFGTPRINDDGKGVLFELTAGHATGTTYTITVILVSDGDTLAYDLTLKVS